jgi:hypothetical protein
MHAGYAVVISRVGFCPRSVGWLWLVLGSWFGFGSRLRLLVWFFAVWAFGFLACYKRSVVRLAFVCYLFGFVSLVKKAFGRQFTASSSHTSQLSRSYDSFQDQVHLAFILARSE